MSFNPNQKKKTAEYLSVPTWPSTDVSKVPSFVWGWCVVWWHSYRNWILWWEEIVHGCTRFHSVITSCTWWTRSLFSILNYDLKLWKELSLISMLSFITNHLSTWFGSLKKILVAIHLYPTLQKQIDRFNRWVVTPVEAKLRRQWLRFT